MTVQNQNTDKTLQAAVQTFLQRCGAALPVGSPYCIALSGGADSMALTHALAQQAEQSGQTGRAIYAFTVDHGLRAEAAQEAQQVGAWCAQHMPGVTHRILRWQHDEHTKTKIKTRVQEAARHARYDLLAQACKAVGAQHLFVAHHQDDQAETFLMRLSAGSGVQGLGCMKPEHTRSDGLTVLRPLLMLNKADILAYCAQADLPFVNDPSNENAGFERVRMRHALPLLAEDGLSPKRLSITAQRCARADAALSFFTDQALASPDFTIGGDQASFDLAAFKTLPEEIAVRLIQQVFAALFPDQDRAYPPRLEKMEALTAALREDPQLKARTLGGLKFTRSPKMGKITITMQE